MKNIRLFLFFTVTILLINCSKSDVSKPYTKDFTISDNHLEFNSVSESKSIDINIDGIWKVVYEDSNGNLISEMPSWLDIEPLNGSGSKSINLTVKNNLKAISREAKISIYGNYEYRPQEIEIIQQPLGADYEEAIEIGLNEVSEMERSEEGVIELNVKITGTVINDPENGNFLGNSVVLQTEESEFGIVIASLSPITYKKNDIVEVWLLGASYVINSGQECFLVKKSNCISKIGDSPEPISPKKCTLKDIALGKLSATLVTIENVQFSDTSGKFHSKEEHLIRDNISVAMVNLKVMPTAEFKGADLPAGNGSITGIVSDGKIYIRNIDDCQISDNAADRGEEINPELVMWNFNGGGISSTDPNYVELVKERMLPRRGRFIQQSKIYASHETDDNFSSVYSVNNAIYNASTGNNFANKKFAIGNETLSIIVGTKFTSEEAWMFETSTFGVSGNVKLEFAIRLMAGNPSEGHNNVASMASAKWFSVEWTNDKNATEWNKVNIGPAEDNTAVGFNKTFVADNQAEILIGNIKGYSKVYFRIKNSEINESNNFALAYVALTEVLN